MISRFKIKRDFIVSISTRSRFEIWQNKRLFFTSVPLHDESVKEKIKEIFSYPFKNSRFEDCEK
jgi:hypothetical protein